MPTQDMPHVTKPPIYVEPLVILRQRHDVDDATHLRTLAHVLTVLPDAAGVNIATDSVTQTMGGNTRLTARVLAGRLLDVLRLLDSFSDRIASDVSIEWSSTDG